jgi:primase-polymerase (primpol)-like protein
LLHPTKPPVNPHNGRGASHSRPEDWSSYAQAAAAVRRYRLAGVGFVLSEDDGYTGVDLDKCRDVKTGQIEPWAQEIVNLAENYSEVSPSGTGICMIARGKIESTIKSDPAHVELYRSQRYLTITGDHGVDLSTFPDRTPGNKLFNNPGETSKLLGASRRLCAGVPSARF